MFMCPNCRTNMVLKYSKSNIIKKLSTFCKAMFAILPKIIALNRTNRCIADKKLLSGNAA